MNAAELKDIGIEIAAELFNLGIDGDAIINSNTNAMAAKRTNDEHEQMVICEFARGEINQRLGWINIEQGDGSVKSEYIHKNRWTYQGQWIYDAKTDSRCFEHKWHPPHNA